jgi:hypothetical protein
MSSSNNEGSGYGHKLDLLIISYELHVRHPSILVHEVGTKIKCPFKTRLLYNVGQS